MTPKQEAMLIELALVVYEIAGPDYRKRINDALQAMQDESQLAECERLNALGCEQSR